MKRIPPFPSFTFTKLPYSEFIQTFEGNGYTKEDLGVCSDGVNHVYGLHYKNKNKPYIMIDGGIHGDHEWRTGYWVRNFFQEMMNPNSTNPHRKILADLKANFSFFVIPTVNPYGYNNVTRWNANLKEETFADGVTAVRGVDLNRNFDYLWEGYISESAGWGRKGDHPFSEPESRMIRDKVLELKPILYVNTHTWGSKAGGVLHAPPPTNPRFFRTTMDAIRSVKLTTKVEEVNWSQFTDRPSAHNWVSHQLGSWGKEPMAFMWESGGGLTEKQQLELGDSGLLVICMHLLEKLKTGSLKLS